MKEAIENVMFIPENLNLEEKLHRIGKCDLCRHLDKFHYFISNLYDRSLINKRYQMYDGYIPLNYKKMESIITWRHLPKIIDSLIELDIVECNESYEVGKYSKGYKFTDAYFNSKVRKIEIADTKYNEKLNKYRKREKDEYEDFKQVLLNKLYQLDIDYSSALEHIDITYDNNNSYVQKYNSRLMHIEKMKHHNIFFKEDEKTRRIFTNITQIPKDIRRYIQHDGEGLCEIDISNSQPFFINFLVFDEYSINSSSLSSYLNSYTSSFTNSFLFNNISTDSITQPTQSSFSSSSYVPTFKSIPEDIVTYARITSNGTFYEEMQRLWERDNGKKLDRDKVKIKTLTLINGPDYWVSNEMNLFAQHFPNVWGVIKSNKQDDYRQMSIMLQKYESNLIIDHIARKIVSDKPDIPIFTLHDCILTTKPHLQYVWQTFNEETMLKYGIVPKLSVTFP